MKFITWLISLFNREKEKMTEPVADSAVAEQPAVAQPEVAHPAVAEAAQPATIETAGEKIYSEVELVAEQLKKLVAAAGTSAHLVIDELIDTAIKIVNPGK
ncbi:hypothetical protein HA49_08525 [Tatumella morbirosei]|uniref:Uncharacterized protein n=1 Tax=Tatumella morbirosei TaxID=642227 RepID=A0A095TEZ8_9GAMM|nr:hypothetical protein [Tatumella morbirosei]KGD75267.1 hypothetical protein HA49_08525 [Tatumella morbirosei]